MNLYLYHSNPEKLNGYNERLSNVKYLKILYDEYSSYSLSRFCKHYNIEFYSPTTAQLGNLIIQALTKASIINPLSLILSKDEIEGLKECGFDLFK